ncbi:MAG: hypothetical protein AB1497_12055 [Bacillota bacterium]
MTCIAVIGTAKNTGKTTTMSAMMNAAREMGVPYGVTSMGYDGEELDSITLLPKPRLYFREGAYVATARECLDASEAGFSNVEILPLDSALGPICVATVSKPGLVIVAGPARSRHMRLTAAALARRGSRLVLVDGALGRVSPASVVDFVVLAQGASRSRDVAQLARECSAIERLLALPVKEVFMPGRVTYRAAGRTVSLGTGSLMDEASVRALLHRLSEGCGQILVPNAVTCAALSELGTCPPGLAQGKTLVFADGIRLLVGNCAEHSWELVQRLQTLGFIVCVARAIPLLAVTANPYYPRAGADGTYREAYVDKQTLLRALREAVAVPVIDVRDESGRVLMELVHKQWER